MTRALAAAAIAVTATVARPATAQPRPPLPDEVPRDYDDDAERASAFWQRALRPHARAYADKVEAARVALEALPGSPDRLADAERLLGEAIALDPDAPDAHWLLAELHERLGDWRACADERARVLRRAPGFVPRRRGSRAWELERGLAACLARAGEFERAAEHDRRILASGDADGSYAHVHLGMEWMALGRIDDAIAAFELALTDGAVNPRGTRMAAFAKLAAAVAYDRDDRPDRARALLDDALRADRTLSSLAMSATLFPVPADEWYFRGLAESALAGRRAFAIAYFRRYLLEVAGGGWSARARAHIAALTSQPLGADDVRIRGAAVIDSDAAIRAIARRASRLQDCARRTPGAVYSVAITKVVTPSRARRRRAPSPIARPRAGVRVSQRLSSPADTPADAAAARACLERQAAAIALPPVTGAASAHVTAELHVTAP